MMGEPYDPNASGRYANEPASYKKGKSNTTVTVLPDEEPVKPTTRPAQSRVPIAYDQYTRMPMYAPLPSGGTVPFNSAQTQRPAITSHSSEGSSMDTNSILRNLQSGGEQGGFLGNGMGTPARQGGSAGPGGLDQSSMIFQNTASGPQWTAAPATGGDSRDAHFAPSTNFAPQGNNSASDQFFAGANAPMQTGQVTSVTNNPNNQQSAAYQAMIKKLLESFQSSSGGISDQYKALLAHLTGKGGLTEQLSNATKDYGAGQQEMLAKNQKNQEGGLEQDLTTRGLGNTTIRNSLLSGMRRDQGIQQQNLASNIAQQKMSSIPTSANIEMGAYNANPAHPQQTQYLQLLQQLGAGAGTGGR